MCSTKQAVLVGCGMVSSVYLDAFSHLQDRIRLRGVMASTPGSAQAFIDQQTEPFVSDLQIYENTAAIAADDDVDFVILATPPNARLDICQRLAEAGKPVLMKSRLSGPHRRRASLLICLLNMICPWALFCSIGQERLRCNWPICWQKVRQVRSDLSKSLCPGGVRKVIMMKTGAAAITETAAGF